MRGCWKVCVCVRVRGDGGSWVGEGGGVQGGVTVLCICFIRHRHICKEICQFT